MSNIIILVAEDDSAVRQEVVDALSFAGYHVMAAADGRQAMNYALSAQYQLLLLDLIMPHHSGFEVLDALKRNRPGQPVIILSALGEEADRIKGLKMGVDDYVVKPFSVRELLARVDAVLRRSTERAHLLRNSTSPVALLALQDVKFTTQKTTPKKNYLIKNQSFYFTSFQIPAEPSPEMKFSDKSGISILKA